jgi:hypothetical protein
MRVSCYADDNKEPDFIGETSVDLTEALTKGEVDGELAQFYRYFLSLTLKSY